MNKMSKADETAMCELASAMSYREAAFFIREQMGCSLAMAGRLTSAIAADFPDSILAQSVRRLEGAQPA